MVADGVAQLEEQGEDVLGDRVGTVLRHVGHSDSQPGGGGDVDDVVAGREDGDEAQRFELGQGRAVEPGLVGEYDLRSARSFDDAIGRRTVVDGELAQYGETVPGIVARVEGVAVEDDDAGQVAHQNLAAVPIRGGKVSA